MKGREELASPRLRALASRTAGAGEAGPDDRNRPGTQDAAPDTVGAAAPDHAAGFTETCDLCREPIGPRHGHLVDLGEQALRCVCRPCAILFDRPGAGGGRYRLVPERVRYLDEFELSEMDWLALRIPVDLAFFFRSTPAERVIALYPSPMGATESLLGLEHWERIEARAPALAEMEPDVEALLVRRTGERRRGWLVPIDVCYELVGIFRTRWKGLSGGPEVRAAVEEFFEELERRAE